MITTDIIHKSGFKYIQKLPSPDEIISEFDLSVESRLIKCEKDEEIKQVFKGNSDKFILIIGPCAADEKEPVLEYVKRLSEVQKEIDDKIILIARIYTNKPRTTGIGYKGMIHQATPTESPNMVQGLKAIRQLHIDAFEKYRIPTADEMLYPDYTSYLEDILSYVAVGASSVENQQQRLTASGLLIPVGMKNPSAGDIDVMINSVIAGQTAHNFAHTGWEVSTKGNELSHAILRGSSYNGINKSNYSYDDILSAIEKFDSTNIINPSIIIDTNHSNSNKDYKKQVLIAEDVLSSMKRNPRIKKSVKGLMIESYLEEGNQKIDGKIFGKSIMDPCLGWNDTYDLIKDIYKKL